MGKNLLVGVGNKARKAKALYVGVGGKARKVKKVYVGVGGKARLVYTSYVKTTDIKITWSYTIGTTGTSKGWPILHLRWETVPTNASNQNFIVDITTQLQNRCQITKIYKNGAIVGIDMYPNNGGNATFSRCMTVSHPETPKYMFTCEYSVWGDPYWKVTYWQM